jgi:hypothetical protein
MERTDFFTRTPPLDISCLAGPFPHLLTSMLKLVNIKDGLGLNEAAPPLFFSSGG